MTTTTASPRYDVLELVIDHPSKSDPTSTLACLQDMLEPRFEVEPLEHLATRSPCDRRRQVVRIASVMGESFRSPAAFDAELRELTGDGYEWSRAGAIRTGHLAHARG